ncbi:MAG: hypothetical protein QNK37_06930 [Acidobacteriota bacterium]|nr:hypothetical protein [Acidobacteriota bacterium]
METMSVMAIPKLTTFDEKALLDLIGHLNPFGLAFLGLTRFGSSTELQQATRLIRQITNKKIWCFFPDEDDLSFGIDHFSKHFYIPMSFGRYRQFEAASFFTYPQIQVVCLRTCMVDQQGRVVPRFYSKKHIMSILELADETWAKFEAMHPFSEYCYRMVFTKHDLAKPFMENIPAFRKSVDFLMHLEGMRAHTLADKMFIVGSHAESVLHFHLEGPKTTITYYEYFHPSWYNMDSAVMRQGARRG